MLFKSLLEYNNDSIISIDSIGRVTYANPATYEIFGYRYEELNNKFILNSLIKNMKKIFKLYLWIDARKSKTNCFKEICS